MFCSFNFYGYGYMAFSRNKKFFLVYRVIIFFSPDNDLLFIGLLRGKEIIKKKKKSGEQ